MPKYSGSHSRQFISSMATLSPFSMPLLISSLAQRFAFSLNTLQVISRRNSSEAPRSISSYSFQVTRRSSRTSGLISTSAISEPYFLALFSRISVIGMMHSPPIKIRPLPSAEDGCDRGTTSIWRGLATGALKKRPEGHFCAVSGAPAAAYAGPKALRCGAPECIQPIRATAFHPPAAL